MSRSSQWEVPAGPAGDRSGRVMGAGTECRRRDRERMWTVATWSSVLVIQVLLGAMILGMWLPGFEDTGPHSFRIPILVVTGIVVVISGAVAAALLRRTSPTARGVGLSTAVLTGILLIAAVAHAFLFL